MTNKPYIKEVIENSDTFYIVKLVLPAGFKHDGSAEETLKIGGDKNNMDVTVGGKDGIEIKVLDLLEEHLAAV